MNPLAGHWRPSRQFWAVTAFVLAVGLLPGSAGAEVRRICKVSYETQAGWSQEVAVEVRFATGRELNRATKSSNYKILSRYALIRFVNNEVAILESTGTLLGVDDAFDNDDFVRMFRLLGEQTFRQVNETSGGQRLWKIKARDFTKFIDPRANP
jgi:hypothetical protein